MPFVSIAPNTEFAPLAQQAAALSAACESGGQGAAGRARAGRLE